jgi:hypothetical protein
VILPEDIRRLWRESRESVRREWRRAAHSRGIPATETRKAAVRKLRSHLSLEPQATGLPEQRCISCWPFTSLAHTHHLESLSRCGLEQRNKLLLQN